MNVDKKSLLSFAERERNAFERTLGEFVEIPTVSSEPERKDDIARCADRAASLIRELGGTAEVLQTAGNPLVHGTFTAPAGAPSVTIYNHLDVQPASRETEPWDTDPFVFIKQGDRYLGRGTTDDKGPALTALYGIGAAREAGVRTNVQLLWELEEEIGSPNFDDDVVPPSKQELDDFRRSGFTVKQFKKDHGFKSIRTEDAIDVMKRIWAMPAMEIHGVVGGYTGPGIKTVVPPRASVKVSCRLVQNQNPKKIMKLIRDFVKERNRDVRIESEAAMLPYKAPTTGPLADAVRNAMKFAFGREPVFVREGGSIGAVVSMEKLLRAPVMFLGLSLPEHGYHAPNENYDWRQAGGGMVAFAKYFSEI